MVPPAALVQPRRMPRYRRYFREGQTVFLTLATHGRAPWMNEPAVCREVIAALRATHALHPFDHRAHVLLPDHLHLLLRARSEGGIPNIIGCFKRATRARLQGVVAGVSRLWQPRYHDHIVRDDEDFARHLDYVHFNPVKHGLVDAATAWPWSSLAAWQARGVYPSDWGVREPERIRGMIET